MALSCEDAWQVLAGVEDPEIPALSIVDLGIVRSVQMEADSLRVTLTPTYSGCPAMKVIEREAASALRNRGFRRVSVEVALAPAWTSEDISEAGRWKLKSAGIAPPQPQAQAAIGCLTVGGTVHCPYCGSTETVVHSEFGSTACKSLRYCHGCQQPFECFKSV